MRSQVSPATDKKLHRASRIIGRADKAIATHEKKRTEAWNLFIETASEFDQPKMRFIADDGNYMTLQWPDPKPKRNDALLEQKLKALAESGNLEFQELWEDITVRTVDNELLEAAVLAGRIPVELLEGVIETPDPYYKRIRQPWTKKDKELAQIYGVENKG